MAVQSLKSLFPKLVANYGDDVARGVATYGDDVAEGLVNYGDEVADWAKRVIERPRTGVGSHWVTIGSDLDIPVSKAVKGLPIDYVPISPWYENVQQRQPYSIHPMYERSSKGGSGQSLKELMPKLFRNIPDDDLPF